MCGSDSLFACMCVLRLPWRMHADMGLVPAFPRDLITGTWEFLNCRHARISIGSSLEISLFMYEISLFLHDYPRVRGLAVLADFAIYSSPFLCVEV